MEVKNYFGKISGSNRLATYAIPILLLFGCSKKNYTKERFHYHNTKIISINNCKITKERLKTINEIFDNLMYDCGPQNDYIYIYEEEPEIDDNGEAVNRNAGYAAACGVQANNLLPDPIFRDVIHHEQGHRLWDRLDLQSQNHFKKIFERISIGYKNNPIPYNAILDLDNYSPVYKTNNGFGEYSVDVLMKKHDELFAQVYAFDKSYPAEFQDKISKNLTPINQYYESMIQICDQEFIASNNNTTPSSPHISP